MTPAEIRELLRAVAEGADALRKAGVSELELEGPVRVIRLAPHVPTVVAARPEDEPPNDAIDDPATYGLPPGSALPTPDADAYVLGGGWIPRAPASGHATKTPRGTMVRPIGPDDLEDIDPP